MPSLDSVIGEESFTTSSSVYCRTFFPGKGAPVQTGSRVPIRVSDFSPPAHYGHPQTHHPPLVHLETNIHNTKIRWWFKDEIWQSGESSQEASTTDLLLDSCFDCPASQTPESMLESSSSEDPEFDDSSFGSTTLGSICAPGSTVALRKLTIWSALWTTAGYPEAIDFTKDSCTCRELSEEWVEGRPPKSAAVIVFKFGPASLVVTRSPLLFIEANTIFTLSECFPHLWSYMELGCKYLAACVRTHSFAWYFLLSAHDLKRPRVVKEYFMGLVV